MRSILQPSMKSSALSLSFLFFFCASTLMALQSDNAYAQIQRSKTQGPAAKPTTSPKEQSLPPKIEITKPDATSEWCIGSTQTITWRSTSISNTNLKIELLGSDRKPFKQIAATVPNSGSYSWTLTPSQFVFGQGFFHVKISTLDGTLAGESPRFSLGKELTLEAPKSQHTWRKGSTYDIRWFQGCATTATQLKIELLNSSKQSVVTIAGGVPIRSGGNHYGNIHKWTVPPDTPSGKYWMRVTAADNQFMSESSFTIEDPLVTGPISQGITIIKPDAASEWCLGSTQTITWQGTSPPSTNLKIELLGSDRKLFKQIANNIPNSGSYSWTLSPSQFVFGQGFFHVRVSTQDGSSFGESLWFSLGKELTLEAPKSQHTGRKGSAYDIRWFQGCATTAPHLKIELLNSSKQPIATIASGISIRSGGNHYGNLYKWTVPTEISSGTYWIRITTNDNQFISESSFTVADRS